MIEETSNSLDNPALADTHCFHCLQIVPTNIKITVRFHGQDKPMCCFGCQAIAQTIIDSGLESYYDTRALPANKPLNVDELIPEDLRNELALYDHPDIAKQYIVQNQEANQSLKHQDASELFLVIENIICPACIWLIERGVRQLTGIQKFHINYSTHRAQLVFDVTQIKLSQILITIQKLGFAAYPLDEAKQHVELKRARNELLKQFSVAAICSMQVMMLAVGLYFGDYNQGMSEGTRYFLRMANFVISIPCITYASLPFYRSALKDFTSKRLSMDVNISLAILLGSIASIYNAITNQGEIYFDSVTMFTFFLLGARLIEMNARHHAINLSDSVLRVKPQLAHKLETNGDIIDVASAQLNVDDIILIKAGETVAADGVLLDQHAFVDESLLTGESMPVEKHQNDIIIGSSINTSQPFKLKVSSVGNDTVLSQMQRLIARASSTKPKIADIADKISSQFIITLIFLCIASYIYWHFAEADRAFEIMLSVLVISCPCALALATPAALSAGNQALIRLGLVSTRSHSLDTLNNITDIIFDKTGTLTEGKLQLQSIILHNSDSDNYENEKQHALSIACALEKGLTHPIANAFHIQTPSHLFELKQLQNNIGIGVSGHLEDDVYEIGALTNEELKTFYQKTANLDQTAPETTLNQAKTTILLKKNQQPYAYFILQDILKADAISAIHTLKNNFRLHVLSGDNEESVDAINQYLNIEHHKSRCSPEDKLDYLAALQKDGAIILMVGDGLNDSPVLAKADVSIAMASGAALAQTHADMILLSDQLGVLPQALDASKTTHKIIKQNLFWSLIYNVLAIPLAVAGFVVPWVAALGMSASSLIVITNTLRLQSNSDQ